MILTAGTRATLEALFRKDLGYWILATPRVDDEAVEAWSARRQENRDKLFYIRKGEGEEDTAQDSGKLES